MCERCSEQPASVEFVQIIGNVRKHTYLCRECALEHSLEGPIETLRAFAQQIFQQWLAAAGEQKEPLEIPEAPCRECGTTFRKFLESGLLGCPVCYAEFHDALKPVLRRLHGVTRMKTAESERDAESQKARHMELEAELQKALAGENYELAAKIRDELKKIR
ncbi:MAG: UvrB/UvrC motif-containing protein [bacterium]